VRSRFFFELANLAEDRERVRVLRKRERDLHPGPRRESIEEAVRISWERGLSTADFQALLDRLSIELVFTAHPTEAT
jgi:phosphoenolpyruvate carboxylase